MKAIVWKELLENTKWAVLGALALGAYYGYLVSEQSAYYYATNLVAGNVLQMPFTSALCAALFAVLQFGPELRRDQWAFLMHRPVSPATILGGKACAGLLLYAFATGLPYLGVNWWAATPAHNASPYDWRLALDGAADIVTGTFVYFTTISIVLHGWPKRVACPACGKKRLLQREQCEQCGAEWPEVVRDGTEIIEPVG